MFLSFSGSGRTYGFAAAVSIALLTAFLWTAANAATSGTLRGTVVDSEGAVLWMAHVLVRPDLTGRDGADPTNKMVRTGRDGRFSVQLDPGFYDVCVMADAFVPTCQKISVEETKTVEPRFRLGIALDVIKGVADTFPTAKQPK
jgi:hypothetical protein